MTSWPTMPEADDVLPQDIMHPDWYPQDPIGEYDD